MRRHLTAYLIGVAVLTIVEQVDDALTAHREARMRDRLARLAGEGVDADGETSPVDP